MKNEISLELVQEQVPEEKYLIILIGETGIRDHFVSAEEFTTPERIFWKAEEVPNKKEGEINDVYVLYHVNKERRVCVYFKIAT